MWVFRVHRIAIRFWKDVYVNRHKQKIGIFLTKSFKFSGYEAVINFISDVSEIVKEDNVRNEFISTRPCRLRVF